MTEGVQHAAGVQIHIRDARASDAATIATIYNEGIRGRGATFETTERSPEDVVGWLGSVARIKRPFLVADRVDGNGGDAEVVGWVRASEYRSRPCYDGVAEFSVYVSSRWRESKCCGGFSSARD